MSKKKNEKPDEILCAETGGRDFRQLRIGFQHLLSAEPEQNNDHDDAEHFGDRA